MKGYTLIELLIVIALIGTVAVGGFGLYVLWHFISKFW